jgi:hypothetical protein
VKLILRQCVLQEIILCKGTLYLFTDARTAFDRQEEPPLPLALPPALLLSVSPCGGTGWTNFGLNLRSQAAGARHSK